MTLARLSKNMKTLEAKTREHYEKKKREMKTLSMKSYLDDVQAGYDSVEAWNNHKSRSSEIDRMPMDSYFFS